MAYQVNKFNGVLQTTVADGTIDSSTDLRFVGKNYAGYGEVQNENFLHLMENFANTTAPPRAVNGQLWYDSGNKRLKFYDKDLSKWKLAGGAEVSVSEPSGLQTGEFWWDSAAKQLYAWSGTQYILVGPSASPELGTSSIAADTIKDNKTPVADSHAILKVIAGGEVVAIFNALEDFVPASSTGLQANFPTIHRGLTLINTPASGETTSEYRFWGTASNADQLGGYDVDQFVRVGVENPFTSTIKFTDAGFYVGEDDDIRVWMDGGEDAVIENSKNGDLILRITNGASKKNIAIIRSTGVIPGGSTYDLGSSSAKWSTIYATTLVSNISASDSTSAYDGNTKIFTGTFKGNVTATDATVLVNATTKVIGGTGIEHQGNFIGAFQGDLNGTASNAQTLLDYSPSVTVTSGATEVVLRNTDGYIYANRFVGASTKSITLKIDDSAVDPTWNGSVESTLYRSAKTTKTAYSIAARDSAGDLWANIFHGTATAARYADLAEKYLPDAEYDIGTVVVIGGEKEITASTWGQRAIGAISANPAYMMNSELEGGVYVALKGRIPVKVTGSVKKGDRLVAGNNGTAVPAVPHANDVFAIALESNSDTGVKLVEAVIL